MKRALLPLLAVLVVVAGGAIWLGRGSGAAPAPAGGPAESGAPPTAPASESTAAESRAETRKDLAPPAPAPQLPAPAQGPTPEAEQPRPGANVTVIFGGEDAFAEFYRDIDGTGRKSRLLELEGALAEYTDGDPSDPREFQKYQALKDEAIWLRAHIEN